MIKVSKLLAATLVLTTALSPVTGTLAAGQEQAANVSDLDQAEGWAKDAIVKARELKLMNGDVEGTFRPLDTITRQELAAIFANALNLELKQGTTSSFADVSAGSWSLPAIEAVKAKGLMLGDGNGTFRPEGKVTREELAVLLVKAVGGVDPQGMAQLLNVADQGEISPWARDYVAAAIESGLMKGDGGNFAPQRTALRQEVAAVAVRLAEALDSKQSATATVSAVADGKVTINGVSYDAGDAVKGMFSTANAEVLKDAKIQFEAKDGMLSKVTFLELKNSGTAAATGQPEFSGNLVLDGGNATIDGSLKVAADYISLKNLTVAGDFEIGQELKNDFWSSNLKVNGNTAVNGGDQNTVVFENAKLHSMNVNKENVKVESRAQTVVGEVTISKLAAIWGDSSIVYSKVKVQPGVDNVWLYANVTSLDVAAGSGTTVNGTGRIENVNVSGTGQVAIKTTGTIGTITVTDPNSKFTLAPGSKIDNLVLPAGVKASDVIANYNEVKTQVGNVNGTTNPDRPTTPDTGNTTPDPTPRPTPGPTPPPTPDDGGVTAPAAFVLHTYENRDETTVDLKVKTNKPGTVYYVVVPDQPWGAPTVEQVKQGMTYQGKPGVNNGSFTAAADQVIEHKVNGLTKDGRYTVWAVFKDDATGTESKTTWLTAPSYYQANMISTLPFETKNLSEIRLQITKPLDTSVTSTTNPSSFIRGGRLLNYGVGDIAITSVTWDLDVPSMPILELHFDPVTLGIENSYRIGWEFVQEEPFRYMSRTSGQWSGPDIVQLTTSQVKLEAGTAPNPSKAFDVLSILKGYPYEVRLTNLIDYNAEEYQEAIAANADSLQTYTDVKNLIEMVNAAHPVSKEVTNALNSLNNKGSADDMRWNLKYYSAALGINAGSGSDFDKLSTDGKLAVAQKVIDARNTQPSGRFEKAERVKAVFDPAVAEVFQQESEASTVLPTNLWFSDKDSRKSYVGGSVTWMGGTDESAVTKYELVWTASGQEHSPLGFMDKGNGSYEFILPTDMLFPPNANGIGIRAVLADGTKTSLVVVSAQDATPPPPAKPKVSADNNHNVIVGADATMEYSLGGNNGPWTWTSYDPSKPPVFPGSVSVYVRVKADPQNDVPASDTESMSFGDNVEIMVGRNDMSNSFSYATSAMEYSIDDGSTWVDYDENSPQEFPGDLTVQLREKASDILPAGPTKEFVFTSTLKMYQEGPNHLWTVNKNLEYSKNGAAYEHMPFDQKIDFQNGDVVNVREEARGNIPAGNETTYTFPLTTP